MTTLHLTKSIGRQPLRHTFLLITLTLACFALAPAPRAFGVSPAPDGGYAGANTAEGTNALFHLTSGISNTAIGFDALYYNTTGGYNTANGASALAFDTTGSYNTANGNQALFSNTIGSANTATGFQALLHNTSSNNTANGFGALFHNTTGISNSATGTNALFYSTTGNYNTANGTGSLKNNTTGGNNTADGLRALFNNTTGSLNIALGLSAGQNLTTGTNNIDIGAAGVAAESNIIRIGNQVPFTDTAGIVHPAHTKAFMAGIHGVAVTGAAVVVSSSGQLGVAPSSERFKDEIKPMDKTSEAILALKPVTFRYKHELDPKGIPQFGLVAEEVEKVNPDLVARDENGKVYTVRYEAVNAMLLNEFLKAHRKAQQQEATITQLKSAMVQQRKDFEATTALQQKEIQVLTASLKEQAAQVQKVSARLEASKAAPQTVLNNQ
jgi:Chaperone of endosialidase